MSPKIFYLPERERSGKICPIMNCMNKGLSRGASTVELTIAIPILALFLFGFVEFALWYGARATVQQAAMEALQVAAISPKIVSTDLDEIEELKEEVNEVGVKYAEMFLVNASGNDSAIAYLEVDEGTGRAFELTIPTPGEGESLEVELERSPISMTSTLRYNGILTGAFFTLVGSNAEATATSIRSIAFGQKTNPTKPNFYDPCGDYGPGRNIGGGPGNNTCKTFCREGDPNCPSGNCTGSGGECIPCPPNTIPGPDGQCICSLPGCGTGGGMGGGIYIPNDDCTACECDAQELQNYCNEQKGRVPNASSCFGGAIDIVNCKCTPGAKCDPASCNPGNPGAPCACKPEEIQACNSKNVMEPPDYFWNTWDCTCVNCTDKGGQMQNGSCNCPIDALCVPPASKNWWGNCQCFCRADLGLEIDPEQGEEDGSTHCRCKSGFTQVPGGGSFTCQCNITCGTGLRKAADIENGCRCICDTGFTEGGVCVVPECALVNCPDRTNPQYTGGSPNVLYDCECGGNE